MLISASKRKDFALIYLWLQFTVCFSGTTPPCGYVKTNRTCTAMDGRGARGLGSADDALLKNMGQPADGDGGGRDPVVRPAVVVVVLHLPLPPCPHVRQQ